MCGPRGTSERIVRKEIVDRERWGREAVLDYLRRMVAA
jgi:hypothetical protein